MVVPPETFSCETNNCPEKSCLNPWFVTGFCEGESTFTYSLSGQNLALYFAVKVTKAESDLIYKIHDFFQVGYIYPVKRLKPTSNSGQTKSALYYRVTKTSDLQVIVEHFEKYPLQGEKKKRYNIWKEMFLLKKQFRRHNSEKLLSLAKDLSSLNPKNLPWK